MEKYMKKNLLIILICFYSTLSFSKDAPKCTSSPSLQYTNVFEWEEKEMCLDTYKAICENDDTNEKFKKRGLFYMYLMAKEAGNKIYEANKEFLNSKGVTSIHMFNFNEVLKWHENACIDDNNTECRTDRIKFSNYFPEDFEIEISDQVKSEFYRIVDNDLDGKIDHLHEAFNLQKERIVEIAKSELSGKITPEQLKEAIYQLRLTKGVFSTSNKSMNHNFPFLTTIEQQEIKDQYRRFCYSELLPVHNAAFFPAVFRNQKYNITIFCPSDYIGGLEGADTLNSVYRSLAFLIGHELGHQISMRIKKLGVFNDFNRCMKDNFAPKEILGHHADYHDEAQADFWAKKLVGEILKDLKDSPVEERVLFIKETATILCGAPDDQIHHSSEHRLNLALRLTPEFRDAFRCSHYSDQMRLRKPINCELDGERYIMIPEL
jgi:hypothetical protein